MFLSGLEEIDRRILELLIENARYSYSEIGERLGISRVAVKNHIDVLEQKGIIEEYTVVVNPQKLGSAISSYFEIETEPDSILKIIDALNVNDTVTQIYRVTGACKLHVHAVAADPEEMEHFMNFLSELSGIRSITTNVILSRVKDIKGLRL